MGESDTEDEEEDEAPKSKSRRNSIEHSDAGSLNWKKAKKVRRSRGCPRGLEMSAWVGSQIGSSLKAAVKFW